MSLTLNLRITFKVPLKEGIIMQSITDILPNSGWYEREIWDMYGILFQGNNDMRRILTDYGFVGRPMRKDFPLSGYVEVRYDQIKKRIVVEPVELAQEFRAFSYETPW